MKPKVQNPWNPDEETPRELYGIIHNYIVILPIWLRFMANLWFDLEGAWYL